MAKRIVYCADGTWQLPVKNTNVYRLFKALAVSADQVTYYDDGVGAEATGLARKIQGAFGQGLLDKVLSGYTKLAHVFEPGDEIYLFGFSRGAYTARSLGGLISVCGLPSGKFNDECLARVFAAYRDPAQRAALLAGLTTCGLTEATIVMIGVWDTVGSLGIPAIKGGVDAKAYGFLDTTLHTNVKSAFHALAVDEKRMQFPATLWTGAAAPGQTIEQVWFSGCHGDVGGGTALGAGVDDDTRLCDIALGWMVGKAQAQGLTFVTEALDAFRMLPAKYALDHMRETWTPLAGPPRPRAIAQDASMANSVALRVQYGLNYAPPNITLNEEGTLLDSYTMVPLVDESAL